MASIIIDYFNSMSFTELQLLNLVLVQNFLPSYLDPDYAFYACFAAIVCSRLIQKFTRKPETPGFQPEEYAKNVKMGRWTAQPGNELQTGDAKLAQDGIVCFILGASSNQ